MTPRHTERECNVVKERSDADVHFCTSSLFFRFCFYLPVAGFKILFPSAQCRGVRPACAGRGEGTELNAAIDASLTRSIEYSYELQ